MLCWCLTSPKKQPPAVGRFGCSAAAAATPAASGPSSSLNCDLCGRCCAFRSTSCRANAYPLPSWPSDGDRDKANPQCIARQPLALGNIHVPTRRTGVKSERESSNNHASNIPAGTPIGIMIGFHRQYTLVNLTSAVLMIESTNDHSQITDSAPSSHIKRVGCAQE